MAHAERVAVERLREFVVERRHHLGFRQLDLAKRSGLSLAWVGMLEAKRLKSPPRLETLNKLSAGLLLPGEPPGALHNFLRLVLAGSLDSRLIRQVAVGKRVAQTVIDEAVKGLGVSEIPADGKDLAAALFFDQELRSERLDRILALLKVDLAPGDLTLAELFLKRLYDEAPVPLVSHRPQKRRASSNARG